MFEKFFFLFFFNPAATRGQQTEMFRCLGILTLECDYFFCHSAPPSIDSVRLLILCPFSYFQFCQCSQPTCFTGISVSAVTFDCGRPSLNSDPSFISIASHFIGEFYTNCTVQYRGPPVWTSIENVAQKLLSVTRTSRSQLILWSFENISLFRIQVRLILWDYLHWQLLYQQLLLLVLFLPVLITCCFWWFSCHCYKPFYYTQ